MQYEEDQKWRAARDANGDVSECISEERFKSRCCTGQHFYVFYPFPVRVLLGQNQKV